ncbi:M50 family metallopeptidase [Alicyclobacillus curvatus]|nr:M50 family metallopeptidase [Alicyclobacillus curvatus]
MWHRALVLFALVSIHELGHAAMANQLGYDVEEVSLLPFGGVAKLSYGSIGFKPRHEAYIAIAGPLVNLVMIGLAAICYWTHLWSWEFFELVVQLNIWIAVFNLLPGLPLDGGRVLRAARSRAIGFESATREAYRMGLVLAGVLLVIGGASLWAGYPHLGALLLGTFLLVSAISGQRELSSETIRFLDAKRQKDARGPEVVRAFAAPMDATVRDVVRQFSPDRYHMVYVLSETGAVVTILEEEELLEEVFAGHLLYTLRNIVEQ